MNTFGSIFKTTSYATNNVTCTLCYIASHFTSTFSYITRNVSGCTSYIASHTSCSCAGTLCCVNSTTGYISITVLSNATFTGKLSMDGFELSVAGTFDGSGTARFGIARGKVLFINRTGKAPL